MGVTMSLYKIHVDQTGFNGISPVGFERWRSCDMNLFFDGGCSIAKGKTAGSSHSMVSKIFPDKKFLALPDSSII